MNRTAEPGRQIPGRKGNSMKTYYVNVTLTVTAETPEEAQDYVFNDLSGNSDDVVGLFNIESIQEAQG